MKCECPLKKIIPAVVHAEKIVGKKETLPVLSCIVLDAKENLVIRATNLETAIQIAVPARIDKKGIYAVPAQVLLQALQATRGDKITLTVNDDGNITIMSSGGTTTIKTIPHDEFPSFPNSPKKGKWYTLKISTFLDGVQAVSYASSQSMIRPELASIYLSHEDGDIVFVATDSFRLAEKRIKSAQSKGISDVLVPVKNILEVHHALSNSDESDVSLLFDENQVYFKTQSMEIISRVIDGSFPDYNEIIPASFEAEVTLLKDDLATAFKKARIFSNASQQVNFHIYPKKKIFTITAQNFDIGEMSETIEAAVSGKDIDINFNLKYISDCLQSIHTESLMLQFVGEHKPVVIKGVSDASFLYLAMPLNR